MCGRRSRLRAWRCHRVLVLCRGWMFGDQQAFIAWTVRQHNRPRWAAAWERFALAVLSTASSAITRLCGERLGETLARHRDSQAQLDAFNEFAFGDLSDEDL